MGVNWAKALAFFNVTILVVSFSHPINSADAERSPTIEELRALIPPIRKINIRPPEFSDIAFQKGFPKSYPAPQSGWNLRRQARFQALLAENRYDMMVVPFQVDGYALDRPTRSLMTAQLTYGLAKQVSARVPDPYLLADALGDGERRYDWENVVRIARTLGVREIVWTHAGHDRHGQMSLYVQKLRTGEKPTRLFEPGQGKKALTQIAFSDERPPIVVFQTLLPELLDTLAPGSTAPPKDTPVDVTPSVIEIPKDPKAMIADGPHDPVRDAYYFQLLAYLTPEDEERTRERFIEKSLLAVSQARPGSPHVRALKARAYFQLGLRPLALKTLSESSTAEERALHAALNGNLPDLRELASQVESPISRVLTAIDANFLAAKYATIEAAASSELGRSLDLPGHIWPYLVSRALTDWDEWSRFENLKLKQLLDHEFRIEDYTLESIVKGAQAIGDTSNLYTTIDLSVNEHIERLTREQSQHWCCDAAPAAPSLGDYVELLAAIGTDNLVRQANFLITIQGSPVRAERFISSIATVFNGHAGFSLHQAQTKAALAKTESGAAQEALLRQAHVDATNAIYWSGAQTRTAADAWPFRAGLARPDIGYVTNPYVADYPFRQFYPTWEAGENPILRSNANYMSAFINSTHSFVPAWRLFYSMRNEPEKKKAILSALQNRFAGNFNYIELMVNQSLEIGDSEQAMRHLREGIAAAPSYWNNYLSLGRILFEQGELQEANRIFLSWPGFKPDGEAHAVARANNAYVAGSYFYWSGHPDLAKPYYKMSAEPNTGSGGSLASALRLHILNGDLLRATEGMLARARRYESTYAYRDYLGMLHATGRPDEAWQAFNTIVARQNTPHVWETALTGHRMEGADETMLADWAQRHSSLISKFGDSFAAVYLLRAGVTDRIPSAEFAALLERIDDRPTSDLVSFARAYRAIRTGDYQEAAQQLGEAAAIRVVNTNRFGHLLPYYAYASAQSGDKSKVESLLNGIDVKQRRFDYHLARAVIFALQGQHAEADRHLDLARYRRPHTEYRPLFSEYQYAEIIELLFKATKHQAYRQRLVDWSTQVQRYFPWYAWPYGMIAKYSEDPDQRNQAIVTGHYLDRNSERLQSLPPEEIQAALKNKAIANPFDPDVLEKSLEDGAI